MKELTRFDYLVLALAGRSGATAYELEQACGALGLSFGFSRGHLYDTPKRLEQRGLLRSVEERGVTRGRTRYALTDDGAHAVSEWLKSPAPALALDEEVFARLTGGDLVLYVDMAASLDASKELTEERLDALEHLRRSMGRQYTSIPEKLAVELKIDLLRAYLRWIPRATKQLHRPGTRRSSAAGPGIVHGRHHSEFVEEVKELRRAGREAEAQRLLLDLLDVMEAEASARKTTVDSWLYEQLAISYRKNGETEAEIAVLERYCSLAPARGTKLEKRLHALRDRERMRQKRIQAGAGKDRRETIAKIAEARARLRDQGLLDES